MVITPACQLCCHAWIISQKIKNVKQKKTTTFNIIEKFLSSRVTYSQLSEKHQQELVNISRSALILPEFLLKITPSQRTLFLLLQTAESMFISRQEGEGTTLHPLLLLNIFGSTHNASFRYVPLRKSFCKAFERHAIRLKRVKTIRLHFK